MLTRSQALALAWPIVLAQIATAATGVVDTAVMGRFGTATDLGAVAVAVVVFQFAYWAFGFLRMATTGQTAQAIGAGEHAEGRAVLVRALGLGGALGLGLLAVFPAIRVVSLALFQADGAVEAEAARYMGFRIFGAPAALMGFAVSGWLLGTGRTRLLLIWQGVLNGVNIALDLAFVGLLGWGAAGIGAGTAIAEWVALGCGVWLVRDGLRGYASLWDRERLGAMFRANRDILVRTVVLLFGFAWFTNAGARLGDDVLAGNQVLLQLIAVSAFVLDAFAFVAEKEAGEAVGARDGPRLWRAMRITSELALGAGVLFSLAVAGLGVHLIRWGVTDVTARDAALAFLPYCAVVPLLGMPAWQLDGLFLGATRGRVLRNASMVAVGAYILLDLLLRPFGNTGVWTAFLVFYVLRAGALATGLPGLRADLARRE